MDNGREAGYGDPGMAEDDRVDVDDYVDDDDDDEIDAESSGD